MARTTPWLRRGELVLLTVQADELIPAIVSSASPNGEHLLLVSDVLIAGWLGYVPVAWTGHGWETLKGNSIGLRRLADPMPAPRPGGHQW